MHHTYWKYAPEVAQQDIFLGSVPRKYEPIPLNGAFYVQCDILKFVVVSAAEAELGYSFINTK